MPVITDCGSAAPASFATRILVSLTIGNTEREAALRIEMAVPVGRSRRGARTANIRRARSRGARSARSRGKILSLEGGSEYRGRSRGVTVHRLPTVGRDEVILPEETLRLLDRNAVDFRRQSLGDFASSASQDPPGRPAFPGPPGTGKTHTIRYLATNLPGHTTLIVTAEQMGTARRLHESGAAAAAIDGGDRGRRPRSRATARRWKVAVKKPLLNKLLNEMDGLKGGGRHPVRAHHQPAGAARKSAGRPSRPHRPGDRSAAARCDRPRQRLSPASSGKGLSLNDGAGRRDPYSRTKRRQRRLHQGIDAARSRRPAFCGTAVETVESGGHRRSAGRLCLFTGGKLSVKLLGGAREWRIQPRQEAAAKVFKQTFSEWRARRDSNS